MVPNSELDLRDRTASTPAGIKLYHHHIMKTGGTAINTMLAASFGEHRVLPHDFFAKHRAATSEQLPPGRKYSFLVDFRFNTLFEEFDCICDHRPLQWLVPKEYLTFTMFRHPIDRICSLVRDWRRLQPGDFPKPNAPINRLKTAAKTESVLTVAKMDIGTGREKFQNGMCKSLLGGLLGLDDLNAMSDDALLWRASRRLEHLDLVGLQSRFRDSVLMLFDRIETAPPDEILHLNKTSTNAARDELEPADYEELLDMNRADLGLLEIVERRFETQVAETDPGVFQVPASTASSEEPQSSSGPMADSVKDTSSTL